MKTFFTLIVLLGSVTTFAAETCDVVAAKSALTQAKNLNQTYKKCESFECAKLASKAVQNKMCEASVACEKIAYVLYNPCDQRIILTESHFDASSLFKELIRKGLKAL